MTNLYLGKINRQGLSHTSKQYQMIKLFLDLTKAYVLKRQILLVKLEKCGIRGLVNK
jgi:hypothetical protein